MHNHDGGDWYDRWAARHAAVFGLATDADAAALDAWRTLIETAGYTYDELTEATDWLAMNDPPKFRSEHPSALKRRVMAERKKRLQHNEDAAPQHGYFCDLCGGKGWVVVPHLQCVVDGQWVPPYTTYAVCCMCSKGEQVADSYLERKEKQMKLGYYEGRNPGWHMQLSQRRQQAKLEAAAIEKGRLADANAEHMRDDPFKKALERIKGRDVHLNGQFDSFKNGKVGEE